VSVIRAPDDKLSPAVWSNAGTRDDFLAAVKQPQMARAAMITQKTVQMEVKNAGAQTALMRVRS